MNIMIQNLRSGMIVARDVFSDERIKLIARGTELTEKHITSLKNYSIRQIDIADSQLSFSEVGHVQFRQSEASFIRRKPSLHAVLRKIPLFSGFNDEQFSHIIQNSVRNKYAANTMLFHEKDEGDQFMVILRGSVKIFIRNNQGEEKILSVLKEGDSLGELSLIDGKPRSASAQTLQQTELMQFSRGVFMELLKTNPDLVQTIMIELSQRLRNTNSQVSDLTFQDARTRVIKSLIQMANRFGRRIETSFHVRMPLNQDELAQMAGVRKEELDDVIRYLENKQILRMWADSFEINMKKL